MRLGAPLLLTSAFFGTSAYALSLGQIQLQSSLGQPLRVQVPIYGIDTGDVNGPCLKARLLTLEGANLGPVTISINRGVPAIVLTTKHFIGEPIASLFVESNCGSQIGREYQLLLDPTDLVSGIKDVQQAGQAISPIEKRQTIEAPAANSIAGSIVKRSGNEGRSVAHAFVPGDMRERSSALKSTSNLSGPAHRKKLPTKHTRSVLRIAGAGDSNDSPSGSEELRLSISHSLSESSLAKAAKVSDSVLSERARADHGLHDAGDSEPVAPDGSTGMQKLEKKVEALERETEQLRTLHAKDQSALQQSQSDAGTGGGRLQWLMGIMLFACIAAILWLMWRMQQVQQDRDLSDWQMMVPDHDLTAAGEKSENPEGPADVEVIRPATNPVANLTNSSSKGIPKESVDRAGKELDSQKEAVQAAPDEALDIDYRFSSANHSYSFSAEELQDEIEQAEFWMDMHQPDRAIEILENRWGIEHPTSPLPWIYLLDLYRIVGNRQKYEAMVIRFRQIFTGTIPRWEDEESAGAMRDTFERVAYHKVRKETGS